MGQDTKNTTAAALAELESRRQRMLAEMHAAGTRRIQEVFTQSEQVALAFTPLVISRKVWECAAHAMEYCAAHKLKSCRQIGHDIKALRERYGTHIRQHLDRSHAKIIDSNADEFEEDNTRDFTTLWWTINGVVKKFHPEAIHDELATYAISGLFFVEVLKRHNDSVNAMVKARMPEAASPPPDGYIIELGRQIERYVEGMDWKGILADSNVVLCGKIMDARFGLAEFEII